MKLLMENWREYLKEETVDEIRNPFRKQDIGGPRKKKTKEADISFDVYKRFWEIHEESELIVAHLLRESDRVYYPRHPNIRERSTDLLLRWLPKARDLFLDKIVPLLDQLSVVQKQIRGSSQRRPLKWPKEMKSEEVFKYAREKGFLDGYETPLEQLDTLIRILLRDTSDLKYFYNRGWQYSDSLRDKLDPPKFPEPPSMNKLFKLINRAEGNAPPDAYPDHRITRTDWAPHRALTTTVDEAWNPLRRKQKADIDYEVLKRIFSAQLRADELARIVDPESNKDGKSGIDRDYEERSTGRRYGWGRSADLSKAKPSFYKGKRKWALELMINLYEEEIEPLLSQIVTVKNQMESGNYRWPSRRKFFGPKENVWPGIGGVMASKLSNPDEVISHALKILYAARNKMLGLYKRYYSQAGLEKYTPRPGIHDLEKLMGTAKER